MSAPPFHPQAVLPFNAARLVGAVALALLLILRPELWAPVVGASMGLGVALNVLEANA